MFVNQLQYSFVSSETLQSKNYFSFLLIGLINFCQNNMI